LFGVHKAVDNQRPLQVHLQVSSRPIFPEVVYYYKYTPRSILSKNSHLRYTACKTFTGEWDAEYVD